MSELAMAVEEIAAMFNAEVLSDEQVAELVERVELAHQSDFVAGWNRSVSVRTPEQPEGPDETIPEVWRQLEGDGFVISGETSKEEGGR